MSDFDRDELELAAEHAAIATLVRGLDSSLAELALDAATLEQADAYLGAVDPTAVHVSETLKSATGRGFLYHAHEHLERHARQRSGILDPNVALQDERALQADREARRGEAKLEAFLCLWLFDEDVPWQHFIWALSITGQADIFQGFDERKSTAVASALGVSKPEDLDPKRILRIRKHIWEWKLDSLHAMTTAEIAYCRWRMRRRTHGKDLEDWFAAEQAQRLLTTPELVEGSRNYDAWQL